MRWPNGGKAVDPMEGRVTTYKSRRSSLGSDQRIILLASRGEAYLCFFTRVLSSDVVA